MNLRFDPIYERIAKTDFVIIKSEVHQMIGYFSGEVSTETGEKIKFENIPGCAEDHSGQW